VAYLYPYSRDSNRSAFFQIMGLPNLITLIGLLLALTMTDTITF